MIIARLATKADMQAIVELSRQGVQESYPDDPFDPERIEDLVRAYLQFSNPVFWVADRAREVVGFLKASSVGYDWKAGHYTTAEVLFVRPDVRGTRAAALLLREFDRWSDRIGANESIGGNDNRRGTETVQRLYEHFGYEPVGVFVRKQRASRNVDNSG
jgi:GNAT superfamily N-acetyltransferase